MLLYWLLFVCRDLGFNYLKALRKGVFSNNTELQYLWVRFFVIIDLIQLGAAGSSNWVTQLYINKLKQDELTLKYLIVSYCGFQENANSEIQNPTNDCFFFFFRCCQSYGDSEQTIKNQNKKQNGSKSNNHNWHTWPFDPVEVNFSLFWLLQLGVYLCCIMLCKKQWC